LALLALLSVASSQSAGYCTGGAIYWLGGNSSGVFGCTGYGAGASEWSVDGLSTCTVSLTSYNNAGASVTVYSGYNTLGTWTNANQATFTAQGIRVILYQSQGYNPPWGYTAKYSCAPTMPPSPIVPLVSSQSVYVANKTRGGFIYVSLGPQIDGMAQLYNFGVASYKGLKPPSFFVGYNRFPTLESYDWTNSTVSDNNGGYTWNWQQNSPHNGVYVIGIFTYGTFESVYAASKWGYNYDVMPFDTPITHTMPGRQYCGQFQLNLTANQFELQVSREAPGGYPIFYVGKGYVPTPTQNEYVLDTNKDSYQDLVVKSPVAQNGPNPGLWLVCTQQGFSGAFVIGISQS